MFFLSLLGCEPDNVEKTDSDAVDVDDSGSTDSPGDSVADTVDTDPTATVPPTPAVTFDGARPKNLLIISVDTLRRDQIGMLSGLDTTPNLDTILAGGVTAEEMHSCSNWTGPAMLCATTGRWPLDDDFWPTGVYDASADPLVPTIPSGLPTLAALLKEQGYKTGLVTANGVYSELNTSDIVEGYETVEHGGLAPDINNLGKAMIEDLAGSGQPWLVHLHYTEPHSPYSAPADYSYELAELDAEYAFPWDMHDPEAVYELMAYWPTFTTEEEEALAQAYLFAVYRGEVRYWDANLGLLWADLDAEGLLDDTLVVFFTDHGEQFGEHDQFQHGKTLFPEESRSFAGFWAKDIVPGRWTGKTIQQDIAPTVLDAMGMEPSLEHTGIPIGMAPESRPLFTFGYLLGYCNPTMSVLTDDHQLIYSWTGVKVFYDTLHDPDETTDIMDASDPDYQAAWALLQPEVQGVHDRWSHLIPINADP